ncbi:MAG: hypothetical protein LUG57_06420 [Oscillospiraceae bacterium]|nr:hypothetical protein [Oscillospiraceae bacterium]
MSWVYDFILVAMFLSMIFKGWRQGMVSALLRMLGWAVALVLITTWSASWSQTVYDNYVEAPVVSAVESAIPADAITAMNSGADALDDVQEVLDNLGGLLGGQVVSDSDLNTIISLLRTDGTTLAQAIVQAILEPVLLVVIQILLSILILIVSLLLFGLLARLAVSRRRGGSILNRTNRILGGVMGALEALITGYIYAYVLSQLAAFITASWISSEILSNTIFVSLYL